MSFDVPNSIQYQYIKIFAVRPCDRCGRGVAITNLRVVCKNYHVTIPAFTACVECSLLGQPRGARLRCLL